MINTKKNGKNVYIKVHPRDDIDYTQFYKNIKILDKNIPMELLDVVLNRPFEEGFTHSSTTLRTLTSVKIKRTLL